MGIWRFENFMELVRSGSINAAAERLHISPQALHQQMDILEREIGCKLLNRSRKGVSLTNAGALFHKRIGALVNDYHQLVRETLNEDQKHSNTVQSASSGLFSDIIFVDALIEFKKQYPNIIPSLAYVESAQKDSYEVLVNNLVYPADSYAIYSSVKMDCFVHVQDTHPFALRNSIRFQDLLGQTLLVSNPRLLDQLNLPFWEKIKAHNSQLTIIPLLLRTISSGDAMVLSTNGVYLCWGPESNLHPKIRQIFIEDSEFEYMMLYNKEKLKKNKALQTYLQFTSQYYQTHWKTKYEQFLNF